ncbi:hypothetical protein ACRQFN_07175, partial [Actinotignum sp. GS-2025e]
MRKVTQLFAVGATMCLALGACSNGTSVSQGKTDSGKDSSSKEVTYRLWDAGQQATYQKCAGGCGLFIGHYRLKPLDDVPQSLNHRT